MAIEIPPPKLLPATPGRQRHFKIFGFAQIKAALEADLFEALARDYHVVMSSRDLRLPFNKFGEPPAFVASCMTEASPSLIDFTTGDDTLAFAESLLGGKVVCVQALAYQRSADTRWHSDNTDARYQGLKLYLNMDSVDENGGALRVIAGSHQEVLRRELIPHRYEKAEQQFELLDTQLPATILSSRPGDVTVFDLRIWHAVLGTLGRRRVVELTYYKVPETTDEREAFAEQIQAHQRQARLSGNHYYPAIWRRAGGQRHQYGLRVLAEMSLLETRLPIEGQ
ncbi:phytanoyl-CoA dioxygenase family protein [Rhizobium ruizarguesonis]